MHAYRMETTIQPDHTLTLNGVPFPPGEKVEVIVLSNPVQQITREQDDAEEANLHPLRGMPIVYHDPFEPAVPESDWEVYR